MARPFGENAAALTGLKRKSASRGQRVLNGLSGAGASGGLEVSDTVSFEIRIWFNAACFP